MNLEHTTQFRNLAQNDLHELVDLEKSLFSAPWSYEQYTKLMESGACFVYGLYVEETLYSYVSVAVNLTEVEIYNVGTLADKRGCGYAKFLLSKVLNLGLKSGITRTVLEVREHNLPAIKLYESFGFVPCGRRKSYYSNPIEDAIVYELEMKKDI